MRILRHTTMKNVPFQITKHTRASLWIVRFTLNGEKYYVERRRIESAINAAHDLLEGVL